jgi:hypothetical protein
LFRLLAFQNFGNFGPAWREQFWQSLPSHSLFNPAKLVAGLSPDSPACRESAADSVLAKSKKLRAKGQWLFASSQQLEASSS